MLRARPDRIASSPGDIDALAAGRQRCDVPGQVWLFCEQRHLAVAAEGHRQAAAPKQLGDAVGALEHVGWGCDTVIADQVREEGQRFDRAGWSRRT